MGEPSGDQQARSVLAMLPNQRLVNWLVIGWTLFVIVIVSLSGAEESGFGLESSVLNTLLGTVMIEFGGLMVMSVMTARAQSEPQST
ncbi:MAG: hypothetical protein AAF533_30535 [Acidobacteriota bacterium]